MGEDQQELLQELLDAQTDVQHQIDILRWGLIYRGGPACRRLESILEEINKRIAELKSQGG
jgi:hypothetical protein